MDLDYLQQLQTNNSFIQHLLENNIEFNRISKPT